MLVQGSCYILAWFSARQGQLFQLVITSTLNVSRRGVHLVVATKYTVV